MLLYINFNSLLVNLFLKSRIEYIGKTAVNQISLFKWDTDSVQPIAKYGMFTKLNEGLEVLHSANLRPQKAYFAAYDDSCIHKIKFHTYLHILANTHSTLSRLKNVQEIKNNALFLVQDLKT